METPNPLQVKLEQAEVECRKLDEAGWTIHLEMHIRPLLCLASTLLMAIRTPQLTQDPNAAAVDRAVLGFIIQNLGASEFLQTQLQETLNAVPAPRHPITQ